MDRKDTLVLKGASILAIALHNYFHLAGPVHENEFAFDRSHFSTFVSAVMDPHQAVQSIFAFLGHFGVQGFIFLSAYGLARTYWGGDVRFTEFMRSRIAKLYPAFLTSIVCWALLQGMALGPLGPVLVIREHAVTLALTLLGISNLMPGVGLPPVGPWWFVPFIVQFYCLWPALKRIACRFGPPALVVISAASVALTYLVNPRLMGLSVNLLETPIGHLPELCLGVAAARYRLRIHPSVALIALVVLIYGSLSASVLPFTFIAALVLILWGYAHTRSAWRRLEWLQHIGRWSMHIFLVNGFVRLWFLARRLDWERDWYLVLVFGATSTLLSVGLAALMPRARTEAMAADHFTAPLQ